MVRIHTIVSVRVSRQCVVSRELVDPKSDLNRVTRMGNLLIFKYLTNNVIIYTVLLPDRAFRTVVLLNCWRVGECRNGENRLEAGVACR
jgi:hypothetical protein